MSEVAGIIAGVVVLGVLFKPFFEDAEHFWRCIRFWFTPDLFSLFRGEWREDWWAEMKLGLWFMCGSGAGFAIYRGVERLLG